MASVLGKGVRGISGIRWNFVISSLPPSDLLMEQTNNFEFSLPLHLAKKPL